MDCCSIVTACSVSFLTFQPPTPSVRNHILILHLHLSYHSPDVENQYWELMWNFRLWGSLGKWGSLVYDSSCKNLLYTSASEGAWWPFMLYYLIICTVSWILDLLHLVLQYDPTLWSQTCCTLYCNMIHLDLSIHFHRVVAAATFLWAPWTFHSPEMPWWPPQITFAGWDLRINDSPQTPLTFGSDLFPIHFIQWNPTELQRFLVSNNNHDPDLRPSENDNLQPFLAEAHVLKPTSNLTTTLYYTSLLTHTNWHSDTLRLWQSWHGTRFLMQHDLVCLRVSNYLSLWESRLVPWTSFITLSPAELTLEIIYNCPIQRPKSDPTWVDSLLLWLHP